MKNLKGRLNELFDEYQNKSLQINDNQNSDYYLYIGKASAMGDLIDEIERYERYDRELASDNWKNVKLKASL